MNENLCCDLQKNQYLCIIKDIKVGQGNGANRVVICRKISTFALSKTSDQGYLGEFAGCDLQKNQYLCIIKDIFTEGRFFGAEVVICRKISTFALSKTSQRPSGNVNLEL